MIAIPLSETRPGKKFMARLADARAALPKILAKMSTLPEDKRRLLGPIPAAVKTFGHVTEVERICDALDLDLDGTATTPAPTPAAVKPSVPAPAAPVSSLGARALEAVTNPATAPAVNAALRDALAARLGLTPSMSCTRAEFSALSPRQKMEFSRKGGIILAEAPPAPPAKPAPGARAMTVRQFQTHLSPAERMKFIKDGGKLTE